MLLNILQGTDQYPQTKTYLSKMSTELQHPCLHQVTLYSLVCLNTCRVWSSLSLGIGKLRGSEISESQRWERAVKKYPIEMGKSLFKLNLQLSGLSLNVSSLKVPPLITGTTDSFNPQTPDLHLFCSENLSQGIFILLMYVFTCF